MSSLNPGIGKVIQSLFAKENYSADRWYALALVRCYQPKAFQVVLFEATELGEEL